MNDNFIRENFELKEIKYTVHHWMSGDIDVGTPVTTSIEINKNNKHYKVDIVHTYLSEDVHTEKTINKNYNLPNELNVFNELNKYDLRNLKNNYFSDDILKSYSHWELEYNNYFKIAGTFGDEPDEIKKILDFLNINNIISDILKEVEEELRPKNEKRGQLDLLAYEISNKVKSLLDNTEFTYNDFFKDKELSIDDKFYLSNSIRYNLECDKDAYVVKNNMNVNSILPWNVVMIKYVK